MNVEVMIADYLNNQHAGDVGSLLNNYAEDPMGGGAPLSDFVKQNLEQPL